MQPGGDETGEVRHVDDEDGTDLIGDALQGREIDDARVGAPATDQEPRPLAARHVAHLVVVDPPGVLAHPVGARLEQHPREVHGRAVRQVATVRQGEPQQVSPGFVSAMNARMFAWHRSAAAH